MRRSLVVLLSLAVAALALALSPSAGAAETAAGVLVYQQVNASTFRYNIHLQDTGTTNVGTLWYAWVPGEDFLAASPTNIVSPTGWVAAVTHGGSSDGFAIQWVNTSGPLTAGNTLSGFGFDSLSTPAQLSGNSQFFPATPVGTTFIYAGAPLGDAGSQFQILPTSTPWRNPFFPLDVNNNGTITPLDALLVINALLEQGSQTLATPTVDDAPPFIDVTGDNKLQPLDALNVINQLLAHGTTNDHLGAAPTINATALAAPLNVPEPGSLALAALACAGFVAWAAGPRLRRWARVRAEARQIVVS